MKKCLLSILFCCTALLPIEAASQSRVIALYGRASNEKDLVATRINCRILRTQLGDEGFENVTVATLDKTTIAIAYENRLYRHSITAIGRVLREAVDVFSTHPNLHFVVTIKRVGIPVFAFRIAAADLMALQAGKMTAEVLASRITFLPVNEANDLPNNQSDHDAVNTPFRKIDLLLQPAVMSRLGNREDPYKLKLDLQPGLSTMLAPGLIARASIRIPIADEINLKMESMRLYTANVQHILPLAAQTMLSMQAGYFAGERYGFSSQIARYFLHGDLALYAQADFTGFLYFSDGTWFHSSPDLWTYRGGAVLQFSPYGLYASAEYGRFLFEDRGMRVAVGRSLREARIDFFATLTSGDRWVGFALRLPFFPNRRFRPRAVRLTFPAHFAARYDYVTTNFGEQLGITNGLPGFRENLSANYFRAHIEALVDAFGRKEDNPL